MHDDCCFLILKATALLSLAFSEQLLGNYRTLHDRFPEEDSLSPGLGLLFKPLSKMLSTLLPAPTPQTRFPYLIMLPLFIYIVPYIPF